MVSWDREEPERPVGEHVDDAPRIAKLRLGAERDPIKAKFLVRFEGKLYFELIDAPSPLAVAPEGSFTIGVAYTAYTVDDRGFLRIRSNDPRVDVAVDLRGQVD